MMTLVHVVTTLLLTASLALGGGDDPRSKDCRIQAPNGHYLAPSMSDGSVQLSTKPYPWFVGPCGRIMGGGSALDTDTAHCFVATSLHSYGKCDPSWNVDLERWVFLEHPTNKAGKGYLLQNMVTKTCLRGDIKGLQACDQAPAFRMVCQTISTE